MKPLAIVALALVIAACSRDEAPEATATVAGNGPTATDRITVPVGAPGDPAARERERFDERWRKLVTFQRQQQPGAARRQPGAAAANIQFLRGAKESFEGMTPQRINSAPVVVPIRGDMSGPSVLKTQVYLDRLDLSPGVIDGRWGKNTAIALWWYQRSRGLQETGEVTEETFRSLASEAETAPAVVTHNVTSQDVEGPFVQIPEDVYEQEKLDCLCYESVREKLAERFHTTTDFLALLNPKANLDALRAGDSIIVPNVTRPAAANRAPIARIVVSLEGNTLNGFDGSDNLVFHAPTTVGSEYDPSPTETLKITAIAHDPHFHYQPKLFHEVSDREPEANLQPGPNSPVGVVWMALSKPHYGIHGTSDPESIGYASSHGCIRLTNWDARAVAERASQGVVVEFADTRQSAVPAE
ncbi:MAG TPA: L,D-transpeptidase family protein [Thermoanaerobaculia bacterium]|nr:L,D-transpeptidase family protein [Thermoanaerobaculia bacterium]